MRLPPLQMANTLTEAFFAFSGTSFPILDRQPFEDLVHYSYTSPGSVAEERLYVVCMVFAIGSGALEAAGIMERHDRALYYSQAQQYASRVINKRDLDCIEALLLECLHTFFNPNGQSLWNLSSLAGRQALELGLHKELRDITGSAFRKERRSRLFWTVHAFDRLISVALGRAPLLRERDIERSPDWLPTINSGGDDTDNINCAFISRHMRFYRQLQFDISDADYSATSLLDIQARREQFSDMSQKWLDTMPTLPSEAVVLLTSLHSFQYYEECYHDLQLALACPRSQADTPSAIAWSEPALDSLTLHACRKLELFTTNLGQKVAYTWFDIRQLFRAILTILWGCVHGSGVKIPPPTVIELATAAAGCIDVVSIGWNLSIRPQESIVLLVESYMQLYMSDTAIRPTSRCDEAIEVVLLESRCYTRPSVDSPSLDSLLTGGDGASVRSGAYNGNGNNNSRQRSDSLTDTGFQAVVTLAKWYEEMMLRFA